MRVAYVYFKNLVFFEARPVVLEELQQRRAPLARVQICEQISGPKGVRNARGESFPKVLLMAAAVLGAHVAVGVLHVKN